MIFSHEKQAPITQVPQCVPGVVYRIAHRSAHRENHVPAMYVLEPGLHPACLHLECLGCTTVGEKGHNFFHGTANELVVDGPFRISRNPIYLSGVLLSLGLDIAGLVGRVRVPDSDVVDPGQALYPVRRDSFGEPVRSGVPGIQR